MYSCCALFRAMDGTLRIQDAQERHEGSYVCCADNGVGPAIEQFVRIKVQGILD